MRLTLYSDYSLRLLMFCAQHQVKGEEGRLVTIRQVADTYRISKSHLMKVAHELGCKGFLETVRGRGGGLRLARPAGAIRLGDVVRAMEEDLGPVECFDPATNTCPIIAACRLKGALGRALNAYLAVLDDYTLADLSGRNNPALSRALRLAS